MEACWFQRAKTHHSWLLRPAAPRSLGCECHHQQNLKTMRGAKSDALFPKGANRNPVRPWVALVRMSSHVKELIVGRSPFRAGFSQCHLLILQGIAGKSCLILLFLLEPKWSEAAQNLSLAGAR